MNCKPDFGAQKWIAVAPGARFEIFERDDKRMHPVE